MRCELYMRHVKDGVYSDFTAEEEELLPKKLTAKEEELLVSSLRYSLSFVALVTKMSVYYMWALRVPLPIWSCQYSTQTGRFQGRTQY